MKKSLFLLLIILLLCSILLSFDTDTSLINLDENQLIHLRDSSAPKIYKNGILFTYKGNAKVVYLSGSFLNWERLVPMSLSYFGVWYYFHKESLDVGQYLYKYKVDNFWVLDPMNPEIARDYYDQSLSLLKIEKKLIIYDRSPVIDIKTKECLFWIENKNASNIYIYGDFNNWNPYQFRLTRDGDFWTIRLKLESGRYGYRFIVDFDKELLDPHNDNIKLNSQNEPCSIVYVP
jgi:1,4-alpha-glucan branching enzyme